MTIYLIVSNSYYDDTVIHSAWSTREQAERMLATLNAIEYGVDGFGWRAAYGSPIMTKVVEYELDSTGVKGMDAPWDV